MKQPIAGVAPHATAETTILTVWPSIAAFRSGQFLGRLYAMQWPGVYIFRLGNLLALLSIPHALFLYFCRVAPWIGIRYTVTNRRVVMERGLQAEEGPSIGLDQFDEVKIILLPGHQWFDAGDLVFVRDGQEVFRLPGVSRPAAFRRICVKSRDAVVLVKEIQERVPVEV